jgi:uncharacterized membrane protein
LLSAVALLMRLGGYCLMQLKRLQNSVFFLR